MSWTRTIPVVVLAAILLSGCTAAADPQPTPSATQPFALAISDEAVREALGPVPADVEFTPEDIEDYLQRSADFHWANVERGYPGSIRPEVVEIDRVTGGNPAALACQKATTGTPQDFAIAGYVCALQHVSVPNGGLSDRQAAYLYDYQTRFVLPCYADKGYSSEGDPPSREYFVANWPFQGWAPAPTMDNSMGVEYDQLDLMCPGIPDGLKS